MQNYHRHSCGSNKFTPDSTVFNEDYAKRAKELGHGILSSVEHGYQGQYHEVFKLSKKYGLKFVFGAEAYWVKDRTENDKTNCHIILLAKNETGRQDINEMLSIANETGYYYKPRIDLNLLMNLDPGNVFITSACVAFWQYDDATDIARQLHDKFGDDFMLEIQCHNTEKQIALNRHIKELAAVEGMQMIVGLDSHYIYSSQAEDRDEYLLSKKMHYDDEEGWVMDYPDDDEVVQRLLKQGVFSLDEIKLAMANTDVVLDFRDYDSPVFTYERKLPTLFPDKTKEEKDKIYTKLISKKFKEYMAENPDADYKTYYDGVKAEVNTYRETGMTDYPLIDYSIVKRGIEYGGVITNTGRGCFTRDAIITTLDGIKHLDEVQIGDVVVDKDGNFQKVTNVMEYDCDEEMVRLVYSYGAGKNNPMICTKDHKILVNRGGVVDWIEAGNIKPGDKVCSPKINIEPKFTEVIDLNDYNIFGYEYDDKYIYEKRVANHRGTKYSISEIAKKAGCSKTTVQGVMSGERSKSKYLSQILECTGFSSIDELKVYKSEEGTVKINRFIQVDYLFNVWVGLMYGDGYVAKYGANNENSVILIVSTYGRKQEINKKVFLEIAKRFNVDPHIKKNNNSRCETLRINSNIINQFARSILFVSKNNKEKKFNNDLLFQSIVNREGIVRGLELSDGHFEDATTTFSNTSKSLISAYRILVASIGKTIARVSLDKKAIKGLRKDCYGVKKPKTMLNNLFSYYRIESDDKFFYLPVQQVISVPAEHHKVYDITVENSHSYMLDNIIVHNSAVSFFTNTLCGFSKVDRFKSPIKLYPERFMSKTRIIETNSLPDIDMNVASQEPFEKAQVEILGEDHAYPMIAFGTLKKKAAFKMYARAKNLDFEIANKVSRQISRYDEAMKYASEEEREEMTVFDFVDPEYHDLVNKSKAYWGIIDSSSKAPCSYLLYQGSIRREIGLIKCKSEATKREYITTVIDGAVAEEFKFLKNDWLVVETVLLTDKIFKRIGIEPMSISELDDAVRDNEKVWDIYAKGLTIGVNQCEKPNAYNKLVKYKPKNVSELAAFIAAIRPGFKSMYPIFESRRPFSYGIKILDDTIQTEQFPYSFILYQETLMAVLNLAGFPMDECYGIIKQIAKKHPEKVRPLKGKFIKGFKEKIKGQCPEGKTEESVAEEVWKIIDDSTSYSFNSSHALCMAYDSLYNAWQKATYPYEFYEVLLQHFTEKGKKDKVALLKQEMKNGFGIKEGPMKWGIDNTRFQADKEHNQIIPSLTAIKGMSKTSAKSLYLLSQQVKCKTFIELLSEIKSKTKVDSKELTSLVYLDYFSEFGNPNQLLKEIELFDTFYGAIQISKSKVDDLIPHDVMITMCEKETAKKYMNVDYVSIIKYLAAVDTIVTPMTDKIKYELEYLGYIQSTFPNLNESYAFITDVYGAYSNKNVVVYVLKTGEQKKFKVKKNVFESNPIEIGEIINIIRADEEGRWSKDKDGQWVQSKNNTETILKKYSMVR